MKFRMLTSLTALTLVLFAVPVMARSGDVGRDQGDAAKMMHKLGRGVVNVFTSWVEVPRHIAKEWERTDPVTGFGLGFVKGVGWGFARFATGVYETFTFPLPVPADYAAMIDPEFVVTDVWGDPVPGISEFEANDPTYAGKTPIYPQKFRF